MTNADQLTQAIEAFIAAKVAQLVPSILPDALQVSRNALVNQTRTGLADELHRVLQK